jgi:hypothetical protein
VFYLHLYQLLLQNRAEATPTFRTEIEISVFRNHKEHWYENKFTVPVLWGSLLSYLWRIFELM